MFYTKCRKSLRNRKEKRLYYSAMSRIGQGLQGSGENPTAANMKAYAWLALVNAVMMP